MKGKKCLDLLSRSRVFSVCLLLLLSLLLSLFPVSKVNALDYTQNLSYKTDFDTHNWTYYYRYGSNSLQSVSGPRINVLRKSTDSTANDKLYVQYFCSQSSYSFTQGDFVELKILTSMEDTNESIGAVTDFYTPDNFSIQKISVDYIKDGAISQNHGVFTSDSYGHYYGINTVDYFPQQVVILNIILRARSTNSYPVCVGNTDTSRAIYTLPEITGLNYLTQEYRFKFQASRFVQIYTIDTSSQDMNEKDEQDRDNLENQKTESQDSSDDSQEDAENTGTTLLAAFSSFVTAITSASPSNCNLLMNMGNLNLGNVNLCQLSPPAEFQVIASIFLILFCVPLSIATARKVINLFRSFQT